MPARAPSVPVLLLAVAGAALLVHARSLLFPTLFADDFGLIHEGWTRARLGHHLWEPLNEHCWPVFRCAVYAVDQCSGGVAGVPLAAMVYTRLCLLAAAGGLFLFVRRERGPLAGVVAATVFAVTAAYQEGVWWLAASPGVACLAAASVGLLAAQRWVQSGQWRGLPLAAAAVAPGWFGGGLMVGPLVSLYLIGRGPARGGARWWGWAVPLAGTAAYLAVCLPLAGERMLRPAHYDGRTAAEAFDPAAAVRNSGRAVADQVALGAAGVWGVRLPEAVAWGVTAAATAAGVWWWRRAGRLRVVVLGAGFVLLSYLLVLGAWAQWGYELVAPWSRYATFPQFGLALIAGGGITAGEAFPPPARWRALLAVGVLALVQLPRGILACPPPDPRLADDLRRVEEADRRCREHHVAADAAIKVLLPHYRAEYGRDKKPYIDIWRCLWGSDHPQPKTEEEIKQALLPDR
jgi:hypothetical protein